MLPTAAESGTGGAAGKTPETSSAIPRPLAPPEVGGYLSDEEEVEVSDAEEHGQEEEEEDQEGLAAAVERLLAEVEMLRKANAFPGLEALSSIEKAGKYLGPTMESNWVLPGSLLVGAYPASMNDSHHAHLLCTILLQGVSTFVCLQQEYRAEGVTEEMWRSGDALRPYFQDVVQLLGKLRELRRAGAADAAKSGGGGGGGSESGGRSVPAIPANICAPEDTDFVHFPIVDCNVADDTKVLQLAGKLATRLARGEVMYLHCWGGHGRTGTVVCIMLHLMYGCSADEAMERCQHVHDVRRIPISVGSPQTEAQREQVRRVIARVISHRSALASSGRGGASSGVNPVAAAAAAAAAASASAPSSEGGRKKGGKGARESGGRRTWVRGRRQAFAQAPNGVGEDVSGWLPDEGYDDNDIDGERRQDAGHGRGKKVKAGAGGSSSSGGGGSCRTSGGPLTSRPSSGALSSDGAGGPLSPPAMPRRKSFTEPYSDEDPSRGTRMSGLRRKSAPGKPPADVLAAAAAAAGSGKEDYDAGAVTGAATATKTTPTKLGGGVPLPLSPANRRSSGAGGAPRHSKGCSSAADASPGSCTGVERSVTRSSGGGGGGASCRAR